MKTIIIESMIEELESRLYSKESIATIISAEENALKESYKFEGYRQCITDLRLLLAKGE